MRSEEGIWLNVFTQKFQAKIHAPPCLNVFYFYELTLSIHCPAGFLFIHLNVQQPLLSVIKTAILEIPAINKNLFSNSNQGCGPGAQAILHGWSQKILDDRARAW